MSLFILVHVTFLAADACLSWSLPTITEQQVCPHRLPMQYWPKNHWPDPTLFKHFLHTNCTSKSAILHNNCISLLSDLCACVHMKKNGVAKEAIVFQWAVRTASWDFKPGKKSSVLVHCSVGNAAVLFENHRELARLQKKKKKKKKEKHFETFWFSTLAMLSGRVVRHENTRRWTVVAFVIMAYKLAVFEIWEIFCISIYHASAPSLHIESTDSTISIYYTSALSLHIGSTDSMINPGLRICRWAS